MNWNLFYILQYILKLLRIIILQLSSLNKFRIIISSFNTHDYCSQSCPGGHCQKWGCQFVPLALLTTSIQSLTLFCTLRLSVSLNDTTVCICQSQDSNPRPSDHETTCFTIRVTLALLCLHFCEKWHWKMWTAKQETNTFILSLCLCRLNTTNHVESITQNLVKSNQK